MNLRPHKERDDMMVWLSTGEVERLLGATKNTEQYMALALAARCGLRSHEVLDVAPEHVVESDAGLMLRVPHGKGEKYRETPMPPDLGTTIQTVADVRDEPETAPLVTVTTTRALRKWCARAATECWEETGDEGWQSLSFHDLRRTWATTLSNSDVDPLMACDWGGWNDLETFLEHYQGRYSPEAQKREREKVDFL